MVGRHFQMVQAVGKVIKGLVGMAKMQQ